MSKGREHLEFANEIEKLADIHCTQRKFELCANEYADVVRMREEFLPENDFSILRALYRSSKSHFEAQQYDLAESEMRRMLSIGETHTDSHETLAFCLYELGFLLYYVGKYREAEPFLLRALPICDCNLGVRHHQTIQVLGGLALRQLGPWHTLVYDVTETGLVEIPGVTRHVRADLILRMKRAPLPKWVASREAWAMWSTLGYCADDAVGSQ